MPPPNPCTPLASPVSSVHVFNVTPACVSIKIAPPTPCPPVALTALLLPAPGLPPRAWLFVNTHPVAVTPPRRTYSAPPIPAPPPPPELAPTASDVPPFPPNCELNPPLLA